MTVDDPMADGCHTCGWARHLHTIDGTRGRYGACRDFQTRPAAA